MPLFAPHSVNGRYAAHNRGVISASVHAVVQNVDRALPRSPLRPVDPELRGAGGVNGSALIRHISIAMCECMFIVVM